MSHDLQYGWISCPYNSSHRMPESRLQWHLVKCQQKKQFRHLFDSCPYNAQHILPKSEMAHHVLQCGDAKVRSQDCHLDAEINKYLDTMGNQQPADSGWNEAGGDTTLWVPQSAHPVGFYPVEKESRRHGNDVKPKNGAVAAREGEVATKRVNEEWTVVRSRK